MSATDFKKTQKELYQPETKPFIIDVPEMTFIMVDGKGDPNDPDGEYAAAIELLYGLSYTIKMGSKLVMEYVVPPLESLWTVDDDAFKGGGAAIGNKAKLLWTAMIRQPDFVTPEVFESARTALQKKKPSLNTALAQLKQWTEGLCVQVLHVGSYDDEPATVRLLDTFIDESGYRNDMSEMRRHHEIYLSDPRKTAPDKLKTVIRHPIAKAER